MRHAHNSFFYLFCILFLSLFFRILIFEEIIIEIVIEIILKIIQIIRSEETIYRICDSCYRCYSTNDRQHP